MPMPIVIPSGILNCCKPIVPLKAASPIVQFAPIIMDVSALHPRNAPVVVPFPLSIIIFAGIVTDCSVALFVNTLFGICARVIPPKRLGMIIVLGFPVMPVIVA